MDKFLPANASASKLASIQYIRDVSKHSFYVLWQAAFAPDQPIPKPVDHIYPPYRVHLEWSVDAESVSAGPQDA
jgi:hypothetical protein